MPKKKDNVIGVNFQSNKVHDLINEEATEFEQDIVNAINKAIENGVKPIVIITLLQMYLFKVTQEFPDDD